MRSPFDPDRLLASDAAGTFAAKEREAVQLQVSGLVETLEYYETLIQSHAMTVIEQRFDDVLQALEKRPSLDDCTNDCWPLSRAISDVGFLEQFFWAKFEHDFIYWRTSFREVVTAASLKAMQDQGRTTDSDFDFLMAACAIENGPSSLDDMQSWAACRLEAYVWSELLNSDKSIVHDRDIPSQSLRAGNGFEVTD